MRSMFTQAQTVLTANSKPCSPLGGSMPGTRMVSVICRRPMPLHFSHCGWAAMPKISLAVVSSFWPISWPISWYLGRWLQAVSVQLKGKCHSVMWPVVQKIWGRPVWPRHWQASVFCGLA